MTTSSPSRGGLRHVAIAVAILLVVGVGLRVGGGVSSLEMQWDEPFVQPIVERIVTEGWSAATALDYEDTKGPVFFWLYAAPAQFIGADVGSLRLVSLAMFVFAGVPLGLIAVLCGLRPLQTAGTATLYALLPYNAVLGQLFMSEPSFLAGSLLLLLVFAWAMRAETGSLARRLGPVLFGVFAAVLLHHRPQVVACAGAIVLAATMRDGVRSWPWWVACVAAALVRIPLYIRWGGMVSPAYQERMGFGLRLESLTYLLVALLPCTLLMLWTIRARAMGKGSGNRRRRLVTVGVGAAVGLVLGLVATPDLEATADGRRVFMGMVATTLGPLGGAALATVVFAVLSALGGACLAATVAAPGVGRDEPVRLAVMRVAAGTVVLGWAMYGLTRGPLFDRYLLSFVAYLPLLWSLRLPWPLRVAQGAGLLILLVKLAVSWLS